MSKWLDLVKQAYESSSAFMDANYRPDLDYSLRAFRNEHANGSKYLSPEYASRSRLFPPKTRSIIRKNEAAGAVALFSNSEVVDLQPGDPDNIMSVASRDAMKQVLEYRLGKTLPTFEIVMGGIQDAQTTGTVVSYQYWEYEMRNGKKVKDKPCIELRPIENIRLDGGANWIDPINTSPYFCDIIPMPVCNVRAMMKKKDSKTGEPPWKKYDDAEIMKARPEVIDSTRKARLGKQQDPHQEETGIKAFDTVWVIRWFMFDEDGVDHTFYTLGIDNLLSDPKPVEEVYFHGMRPYVMGYSILETHKAMKSSMPTLVRPLQQEAADIRNQRLDNVKFVLNKRWIVARGRQVDVQSLVRNVPGGVTLATDPKNDVHESNWPDVTSSAYIEQDRINSDLDDLAGNFTPSTKVANNAVNDTLGGSKMAAAGAGLMTDYLLRTIIETWWEKVLRQLIKLEAAYETDEVILAICAKKARLFPKYGLSTITDAMLNEEMTLTVNVGMGATNPSERFAKLMAGTQAVMNVVNTAPPNFNLQEFIKEAYSNMGYRDGSRFWGEGDPRLMKSMQIIEQLKQALQGKQMDMQANAQVEQMKLASAERQKAAQLQVDYQRIQGDLRIREAELVVEQQKLELERLKLMSDAQGMDKEHQMKISELSARIEEAQIKLAHERLKIDADRANIQHEMQTRERETQAVESNESRVASVATEVKSSMEGVKSDIDEVKKGISDARAAIGEINDLRQEVSTVRDAVGAVAGVLTLPKKKPKGFQLKKQDGKKTNAVIVQYDDGSSEELSVQ